VKGVVRHFGVTVIHHGITLVSSGRLCIDITPTVIVESLPNIKMKSLCTLSEVIDIPRYAMDEIEIEIMRSSHVNKIYCNFVSLSPHNLHKVIGYIFSKYLHAMPYSSSIEIVSLNEINIVLTRLAEIVKDDTVYANTAVAMNDIMPVPLERSHEIFLVDNIKSA